MKGFGSDNHAGVHPLILEALTKANLEHAPAYGTDDWSQRAEEAFRQLFGAPKARVFFVFNGTAANVLSLRAMMKSHETTLCSSCSHLHVDECASPEFFSGGKLMALDHTDGLLSLQTLQDSLIRRGDQHFSQARVVSLTEPTEYGTLYDLQHLRNVCSWAHKEKLFVHVDGARLANAVVSLGTDFKTLLTHTGVDVVSFGGTKNGLMFGEAVIFLNPDLAEDFKYIRKQSAQLPSKTRFVAAQFEAYLTGGLWKEIASHSLAKARELEEALRGLSGITITRPVQSNVVFAKIPAAWIKSLREHFFFYVWDEKTFECRLMTSWDTSSEEIRGFVQKIKELAR